jgi:protein TonB
MTYSARLLAFLAVSVALHLLCARGVARLPDRPKAAPKVILQVQLRPPPPEPEKEPEPPKPAEPHRPPPAATAKRTPAEPAATARPDRPPRDVPPTERPSQSGDGTLTPTFGISLESTSQGGAGPALPVGNTLRAQPTRTAAAPAAVKPLLAPVPAYQVTTMPLPKGRCSGDYTDAAKQAGIEGTVVLDLVVGEDGTARDIKVVQGLGHGLTEAAVAALKRCRFTPGERDGQAVPVRVRGFKIRFFLQGGD